jgi:phage terminase small subunit
MLHRGRKSTYDFIEPVSTAEKSRSTPLGESAPGHLAPAMRDWWTSVVSEVDLEPHRLRVLEAACGAWDRMVQAREAVAIHGMTFEGKDGPRPRPEVAIERDARIAFARLVRDLGLDTPVPQPRNEIGWQPPPKKPWA